MLIITDEKKLPAYGFKKSGSDIWVLNFSPDSDNELSMIVNPLNGANGEIIMTLTVTIHREELQAELDGYGIFNCEYDIPLETVCRMLQDGVMKIVESKKAVA